MSAINKMGYLTSGMGLLCTIKIGNSVVNSLLSCAFAFIFVTIGLIMINANN